MGRPRRLAVIRRRAGKSECETLGTRAAKDRIGFRPVSGLVMTGSGNACCTPARQPMTRSRCLAEIRCAGIRPLCPHCPRSGLRPRNRSRTQGKLGTLCQVTTLSPFLPLPQYAESIKRVGELTFAAAGPKASHAVSKVANRQLTHDHMRLAEAKRSISSTAASIPGCSAISAAILWAASA